MTLAFRCLRGRSGRMPIKKLSYVNHTLFPYNARSSLNLRPPPSFRISVRVKNDRAFLPPKKINRYGQINEFTNSGLAFPGPSAGRVRPPLTHILPEVLAASAGSDKAKNTFRRCSWLHSNQDLTSASSFISHSVPLLLSKGIEGHIEFPISKNKMQGKYTFLYIYTLLLLPQYI